MNYRHAYHAGNLGDVLKHAVLARLIIYLQRKDKGFRLIDTHAGIGRYDLRSEETSKTGEWLDGVAKVLAQDPPADIQRLLAPWLDVVRSLNEADKDALAIYPGSPDLARALLRPQDRLTLTELHPQDYQTLAALFAGDHQVKVVHLDGWLAMNSFLPPKEKRGLVLIDPAFEKTDEFQTMGERLAKAWRKWPGGTYALWYPLKDRAAIRRFHQGLGENGIRDAIALELSAGKSTVDGRMRGSGMVIVNPPFTLWSELETMLPWLCKVLAQGPDADWSVTRLTEE